MSRYKYTARVDCLVSGYRVQNHFGTLESAKGLAKKTIALNRGNDVAVVKKINSTTSSLGYWQGVNKVGLI